MMDMIERVARALLARRGFGFYTDPMEGGQDAYDISCEAMEEARDAIEAMREPTDAMVRLGFVQMPDDDPGSSADVWRAMIDAAPTPPVSASAGDGT